MRAKKTLRLPRPRDLKSNKKEDIQDHLRLLYEELDKAWRLLWQDVAVIQIDDDGWLYFGGKDTNGTWRIGRSGDNLITERRESGAYVTKDTIGTA